MNLQLIDHSVERILLSACRLDSEQGRHIDRFNLSSNIEIVIRRLFWRRCRSESGGDKAWGGYHYPRPHNRHYNHSHHWHGQFHSAPSDKYSNVQKTSSTMDRIGQWPADGQSSSSSSDNLDYIRDPKKNKVRCFRFYNLENVLVSDERRIFSLSSQSYKFILLSYSFYIIYFKNLSPSNY